MTPELERRTIAFVRTIANRCDRCLRRNRENCRTCASAWANEIMKTYDEEQSLKPRIDYSMGARVRSVMAILESANRPIFAHEIDLSGICTKQLKHWTLMTLLEQGRICRAVYRKDGKHTIYRYFLPTKKPQGIES